MGVMLVARFVRQPPAWSPLTCPTPKPPARCPRATTAPAWMHLKAAPAWTSYRWCQLRCRRRWRGWWMMGLRS